MELLRYFCTHFGNSFVTLGNGELRSLLVDVMIKVEACNIGGPRDIEDTGTVVQ